MDYILEVEGLSKSYDKSDFKLKNVTFSVPKGSIMGFVGENGAGKTTTISAILNIIKKDSGSIKIFGNEMMDSNTNMRQDIGVVFDAINFPYALTTRKLSNVFSKVYTNWDERYFQKLVKRFNIPEDKRIKEFSRGMTMKLAIVAAMSHLPKLLILDEATSGLDPIIRDQMLDLFLEFVEDENHSILMSSHISSDLEKVADYITFIQDGKIILTEKKDTLIYEYGIARCKEKDFLKLSKDDFIRHAKRGLQIDVLVTNKHRFEKKYKEIIVDSPMIDEITLLLMSEGGRKNERFNI